MKNNFTQEKLNSISSKLTQRLQALRVLEKENEQIELEGLSPGNSDEAPPTKFHQADLGSLLGDQEVMSTLVSSEIRQMRNIEDALDRIETGHYGQCEKCRKSVPQARLEQIPEARFCENCEKDVERYAKIKTRRLSYHRPDFRVR